MARLYVLRHGQTEFNLEQRVQGRCDSPLTELGVAQAHAAGSWLAAQGVCFERVFSSPLGRAMATAEVAREELAAAGLPAPEVEPVEGLIERSYGPFEGGPAKDVPTELWDPGEALVPYGGEGSAALRSRIVGTLTDLMVGSGAKSVLAVSHGSATLQFKLAWEHLARCPQDVRLGNCCVLVFDFDRASRQFANVAIVNQRL